MSQLVQNAASFGLFLTLGAYLLGVALNKRFKLCDHLASWRYDG